MNNKDNKRIDIIQLSEISFLIESNVYTFGESTDLHIDRQGNLKNYNN